jgi:hypothetical protein
MGATVVPVSQITATEFDGLLKQVHSSFRMKFFPIADPVLAQIKKGTRGMKGLRWSGRGVAFDTVMNRPVGVVANQEGWFPKSAQTTEVQGNMDIKRMYVTRVLDGLADIGTTTKEGAYIGIAKKLVQEAMDATKLALSEVIHGDGRGVKGIIRNAVTNTFNVDSPYGYTNAGPGALLLDRGQDIAILSADGLTLRGRSTIASITQNASTDTAVLVLDTALASAATIGDIIVAATNAPSGGTIGSMTGFNQSPNGLGNLLNRDGTSYNSLHGISAATHARWDALRLTASGVIDPNNPNEMDVWELATKIGMRSGMSPRERPGDFMMMGTYGIERKLAESFLGARRFMPEGQMKINGGYSAVNILGMPYISSGWAPAGEFKMVHTPSLVWIDGKDWGVAEVGNNNGERPVDGRDAKMMNWGTYWNLGLVQRNSHGMISGYTDTSRYTPVN